MRDTDILNADERGVGVSNTSGISGKQPDALVTAWLFPTGIANEIAQLAFGLVPGAIAVAVAPSFGLDAREAAGQLLKRGLNGREDKA